MSFAKKLESPKSQTIGKEDHIKYKVFERLSEKGFLKSMQKQMRKAIADELNGSKYDNKVDQNEENEFYKNNATEEGIDKRWESLTKVSSIANWEKQIRYELEIDREIQTRELERQRDRLKIEWKKLNERDKSLRIELDARERKIRIQESQLKTSYEDIHQKLAEIASKEEMINDIVNEKIKSEMKDEIERLKKKFNELELNKLNLTKREDKVKEVEARLHEQVKIVKEKIDGKRFSEIELAKYRKELEIIKNENQVLKQRVESMGDYQLTKFENKSLKSELNAIKETLNNRIIEFDKEKDKWEKAIKSSDEKVLSLKMDLRKCEQELLLLKQKHQGDIDEYNNTLEQINGQLKQSKVVAQQLANKNHLLSKEIILSQNQTQKLIKFQQKSNNSFTQTDGEKFGCHLCDHNINLIEESALQFVASSHHCISDSKRDTQLGSQPNHLNLQLINSDSMPLTTTQENMKSQIEVPLISNAIQNTVNTSAKHETNHKTSHKTNQNGGQSTFQTNYENKLQNDKTLQDFEKNNNELPINFRDKTLDESLKNSYVQENDNKDPFDW